MKRVKVKTAEAFLRLLAGKVARRRRKDRKWRLDTLHQIRLGEACPISFLGEPMRPAWRVGAVAAMLGMPDELVEHIVAASDNSFQHRRLRERILAVVGLKEKSGG